jgi:hypothetical protein
MRCAAAFLDRSARRNRRWAREHPSQRDEAWFNREIAPKLDAFSLKKIAKATAYRSRRARGSGRARGCRTQDIGILWSR